MSSFRTSAFSSGDLCSLFAIAGAMPLSFEKSPILMLIYWYKTYAKGEPLEMTGGYCCIYLILLPLLHILPSKAVHVQR